jgi:hypothetical protein
LTSGSKNDRFALGYGTWQLVNEKTHDTIRAAPNVSSWNSHSSGSQRGGSCWFDIASSQRGNGVPARLLPCRFRRLCAISKTGLSAMPEPDRDLRRWRLLVQ